MNGTGSRAGAGWATTAFLFAGAALAFALLRQGSLHGFDIYYLLRWFDAHASHAQHPAWLPLAYGLHALLAPLGARPFDSMCLLSAFGMAAGVAFVHRAALVNVTEHTALWCALLAGTVPAIVHFATVAEMHGAFFGVACVAWWQCARLGRDPRVGNAVLLGACGGAATLVHASGLALPLLWVLALPSLGRIGWRRLLLLGACAGAVQVATTFVGLHGLRLLWPPAETGDVDTYLRRMFSASQPLPALPHVLWSEWLRAYAVASFAALVLLLPRRSRREALLLHTGVAALVAACAVLLYAGNVEHGAYLVPLAFPLALLLARSLSPVLLAVVLLGNVAATTWHLAHPERPPADAAFGDAVAALERERKVSLLVGDWDEYDGVLRYQAPAFTEEFDAVQGDSRPRCGSARLELRKLRVLMPAEPDAAVIDAWLQKQVMDDAARGASFLVTDAAVAFLQRELPAFAKAWESPLPAVLRVRCERGPLRGTELRAH